MAKDFMKEIEIVDIELTNACNTICAFCPREKMTRPVEFMSDELFRKIVDECAKENIGEINLIGYGEILLDPKLIERIKYIKSKFNPILTTATNCALLTPKINKQLVHSGLDEIKVSVYSMEQMEYKQDQKFDLKNTLNNLKDLKEQKKKNNTNLPYVVICFIKGWHDEKISEYKTKIKDYIDKIEPDMTLHNFIYGRDYNKVKKTNLKVPCIRPNKTVIIRCDGDVVPCPFDFDSVMVLGNVRKNTIREVISSERYQDFCEKLQKRRYNELQYCNICDEPVPYTIINRLRRFYYVNMKRQQQIKKRDKFYNRLRQEERFGRDMNLDKTEIKNI